MSCRYQFGDDVRKVIFDIAAAVNRGPENTVWPLLSYAFTAFKAGLMEYLCLQRATFCARVIPHDSKTKLTQYRGRERETKKQTM